MTTTTNPYPAVPLPAGAAKAAAWETDDPIPSRCVYGIPRGVTDTKIVVEASASQWADGSVEQLCIDLTGANRVLNSDQARELAAALLEAAAEIDGWAGR